MKLSLPFTPVLTLLTLVILAGCATTETTSTPAARETTLAQAGFQTVTVTSPDEQKLLAGLPVNQFSRVRRNNDVWYVLPTGTKNTAMVGRRAAYDAYVRMTDVQHLRPLGVSAVPVAVWRGSGGTVWGERVETTRIPPRPS